MQSKTKRWNPPWWLAALAGLGLWIAEGIVFVALLGAAIFGVLFFFIAAGGKP